MPSSASTRTTSVTGRPRASRAGRSTSSSAAALKSVMRPVGVDRDQGLAHAGHHRLEPAAQLRLLDGRGAQIGGHGADGSGHRVEGGAQRAQLVVGVDVGGDVEVALLDRRGGDA